MPAAGPERLGAAEASGVSQDFSLPSLFTFLFPEGEQGHENSGLAAPVQRGRAGGAAGLCPGQA